MAAATGNGGKSGLWEQQRVELEYSTCIIARAAGLVATPYELRRRAIGSRIVDGVMNRYCRSREVFWGPQLRWRYSEAWAFVITEETIRVSGAAEVIVELFRKGISEAAV